jgi:phage-related protein
VLHILKQCQRELKEFPEDIRGYLADTVARLEEGHTLSLPLSRPMKSVGKRCHELRFKDKTGIYRVIYVFIKGGDIWLIHAFKKKTQKTPKKNLETAKKRLKEVM